MHAPSPVLLIGLTATGDCKRLRRHILSDHRARADIGAVSDLYRRDQCGIRSNKGILSNLGAMLGDAIVIARDRAGTDICARPNGRVTDIAEVIGLGARSDHGLLDLDEIANMHIGLKTRAGAQPGIGSHNRSLPDASMVEMGE